MEEIDRHILQICHELECSFIGPNLYKLEQLSLENNIEILVRCLWLITPTSKEIIPSYKLSKNILERFQMATSITNLLKKHNVLGEFGYQTLLYGSTAELRKVFIAVVEKLPKGSSLNDIEQYGVLDNLLRQMSLDPPLWVPEFCRRLRMRREGRFWAPPDDEPDNFLLFTSDGYIFDALAYGNTRSALANIIRTSELTSRRISRTKPRLPVKPSIPRLSDSQPDRKCSAPEKEICEHSDNESSDRRNNLAELFNTVAEKKKMLAEMEGEIAACRSKVASTIGSFDPKWDDIISLLTQPEVLKTKMVAYLGESDRRMEKLEKELQNSYEELAQELEKLKNQQLNQCLPREQKVTEYQDKLDTIRREIMRTDIKAEKMRKRLEKTKKRDVDRVLMIRRIMEMTGTIRKQDREIDKVFAEILTVQRELKWLTQTLYRTFNTIEEALFKETEDQKGERAYKLFGKLHLSCMASVEAIEWNGSLSRQNEELLNLIEIEKQNRFDEQLTRIESDLRIIVEENKKLCLLLEDNA
ncbi:hypothetical protein DICVIV_11739 [Dictyocaulus viviparus]|uniref:Coiled-coil domain-containing protein 22 homolog n=1 Tax=Dictyocaulus viviparus TaxID=29172 RepID=A0A0D8XEW5_DICVI|nr:hypothetical protein DICVIV_11739 [Dictyocaulus viviparus]